MSVVNTHETVETTGWTDRELLLQTYHAILETNGSVRRHEADLYGDAAHGVPGMKAAALGAQQWIDRATVVLKVIATLVSLLGLGGITQLVIWIAGAH